MADTTFTKRELEPYVRDWLSKGLRRRKFDERPVSLGSWGGTHRFDAVSEDETIVGNILSNRASTRTGRENTGGVKKALNDIQLLNLLPPSVQTVMVFTDGDFCRLVCRRSKLLGPS